MAHQDVVPVNREIWDSWQYPPFSGHYDQETDYVWGRGSNDCKNLMLAELEGIEQLLADGYQTERTVILSLGFDEESRGFMGAKVLAPFLLERYGPDSMFSIIDEGAGLLRLDKNLYIAAAVNAEKGYVDVRISIHGHGGHSSVQPDHTTIGVASELIYMMENHPFDYNFSLDNPIYDVLQCAAEHSGFLPPYVREAILKAPVDEGKRKVLTEFAASHPDIRDLIRTTRAVDVINGGVKANALPGLTSFIVNHRVDIHSSVNETV
ncbi:BBF_HP2_G0046960.mRNA.1.CDS.1 [Saccharomyces cerevisiae]|nr:BBF_HP2_G0046960.mRNA.1.CDS.1 [Saccharomyces cerevisiae]CAI6753801.1 BBF_HP2_G0046960.mRNA.1.CDS.1 [Saccharomyces cerevisiae]CAI6753952.1 ADM_HP1_G0045160.mRNA.1.CDS.1 [Saccharomyces cerevisiae]CAI6769231.1 BBF_HP1_G0048560.mRNA.1.CDS.1 [Saccharomyces cerevisiae]